jgi:hypothetical protein
VKSLVCCHLWLLTVVYPIDRQNGSEAPPTLEAAGEVLLPGASGLHFIAALVTSCEPLTFTASRRIALLCACSQYDTASKVSYPGDNGLGNQAVTLGHVVIYRYRDEDRGQWLMRY